MTVTDVREMPEQDVKMASCRRATARSSCWNRSTPDSGIGRYLAKRGEGLHHICLEVDDIEATLADLKAEGAQLIDETPKQGAYGKIAFIHPKGAHGVLVELLQRD